MSGRAVLCCKTNTRALDKMTSAQNPITNARETRDALGANAVRVCVQFPLKAFTNWSSRARLPHNDDADVVVTTRRTSPRAR